MMKRGTYATLIGLEVHTPLRVFQGNSRGLDCSRGSATLASLLSFVLIASEASELGGYSIRGQSSGKGRDCRGGDGFRAELD
jgi:hypothetical protein